MKKILGLFIAAVLLMVCLSGCGTTVPAETSTDSKMEVSTTEGCEHEWSEATCTELPHCIKCGIEKVGGLKKGHKVNEWTVVQEPTCSETGIKTGICETCGETVEETVKTLDHTWDEGVISEYATNEKKGLVTYTCVICGATNSVAYELSDEEKEAYFKSTCTWYGYEELARNSNDYKGLPMAFQGEVIQTLYGNNSVDLRMNVTRNGDYFTYYSDTILVSLPYTEGETKILEDDIINVYGIGMGDYTYTSILGASITLPLVIGKYWELVG